jgi:hypothetical protein
MNDPSSFAYQFRAAGAPRFAGGPGVRYAYPGVAYPAPPQAAYPIQREPEVSVGQTEAPAPTPPAAKKSEPYPWYFWVGAGVALVGVSYVGYRYVQKKIGSSRDPEPIAAGSPVVVQVGAPAPLPPPMTLGDYVAAGPQGDLLLSAGDGRRGR